VADAEPERTGGPEPTDEHDPPPNAAARAVNWWVVLLADAALGVVLVLAGLALLVVWDQVVVGAGVAALGMAYGMVVWRRRSLWLAWRRRNGLG
jgi:hypothetical protein